MYLAATLEPLTYNQRKEYVMNKKFWVYPFYHSQTPRFVTRKEAETMAYFETLFYFQARSGMLGENWMSFAITNGLGYWAQVYAPKEK
jgi:hypothetical protein